MNLNWPCLHRRRTANLRPEAKDITRLQILLDQEDQSALSTSEPTGDLFRIVSRTLFQLSHGVNDWQRQAASAAMNQVHKQVRCRRMQNGPSVTMKTQRMPAELSTEHPRPSPSPVCGAAMLTEQLSSEVILIGAFVHPSPVCILL